MARVSPIGQTHEEVLAKHLEDPEFRRSWEENALAREFGTLLIFYRSRHDLSQSALAELLGVKQEAVARWECSEQTPTHKTLMRVCEKLGIEICVSYSPDGKRTLVLPAEGDDAVLTGARGNEPVAVYARAVARD